jgi:aryl-alcohol dehydrogenase-like predicted oxidoreductase
VTAAIVGARRPVQIEETAAAAAWGLWQEDIETIDALLKEHQRALNLS